jgi:hypothetical protein
MSLFLFSVVSRQCGNEIEGCLCHTRCKGAMDWKLECSVSIVMRYGTYREGWRKSHPDMGINRFSCSPQERTDQYPPSIMGHYKATKHCPYHKHIRTHRFWYVYVDNLSQLYKNTNLTSTLTSRVQRPHVILGLVIHDDSAGGEMTPLQAGCPRNSCSIPDGEKNYPYLLGKIQLYCGARQASYFMGNRDCFAGIRRPRRVADHSLYLVTGLRMSGVINSLPHTLSWRAQGKHYNSRWHYYI